VGIIVGLLAAACFGSGDFLGGRASRAAPAAVVLLVAQVCAAAGAVVLAFAISGDPSSRDLAYGAAAGLVNAVGLGFLYRGLATGRMGVVAPVAAVVGSVIPVAWGLIDGEEPGTVVLLGVGLAIVAGALIAREHDARSGPAARSVILAVLAGAGLGTSFVLFAHTGPDSGMWPVLSARLLAVLGVGGAVGIMLATGRTTTRLARTPTALAAIAGTFDVTATALLLVAIRADLAVVVAPIAALAPGFTVLWAWTVLREPASRIQVAGLGLALCGLVLIAAG
jgi:drug/metabolite transporter (DMT)-like permease